MPEGEDKLPAWRFLIQEIRKLLVPVIVAVVAGGAAGSTISHYQGEDTKEEAVKKAEEKALEVDLLRGEIRKIIAEEGNWDEVTKTITVDENLFSKVDNRLDEDSMRRLVKGEARHMAAQREWAAANR